MSIRANLSYFLAVQKYRWYALLAYRINALIWFFYNLFGIIYSVITISVIYDISSGIAGWTYFQMLMLTATTSMVIGIIRYFVSPGMIYQVRQGGLDMLLTKPYSKLTVMLSNFTEVDSLSAIVGGIVLFAYASMHVSFTSTGLLMYLVLFTLGTITFVMFLLTLAVVAYTYLKSGMFIWRITSLAQTAGTYPLYVFGLIGQIIFTIFVPIGLANYYPANLLFNGINIAGFAAIAFTSLSITFICYKIFYKLMSQYSSGAG